MVFYKTFKSLTFIIFFCLITTNISYADKGQYQSPESVEGAITTSLTDAKNLFDQGVIFIDVRNPRYYAKGHIPGAHHFDFKYNFDEKKLNSVAKKDQPIVIYCSGVMCSRSYRASTKALSWGYSKVHYFRDGFAEWKKAAYKIETITEIKTD